MAEELFDLEQAERLLPRLECLLRGAIDSKQKIAEIEQEYADLVRSIYQSGGRAVDLPAFSNRKKEKEQGEQDLLMALQEIQMLGCVVKDLCTGLIDFPCRVGEREVYLCWRLGEPSIRFWHAVDEGFAGRKPIDETFLTQLKPPRPV